MRALLESSWMKFGPAGRDSLDWVPGPSALPSTDRQSSGSGPGDAVGTGPVLYIVIATISFFLLLLLTLLGFLVWRRRRAFGFGGKLALANVIALEDLQDPERSGELLLTSIRHSRAQKQLQVPSSGSGDDVTEGVFLMVYLPSPYEQTLTRIARAASMCSARDVELLPPNQALTRIARAASMCSARDVDLLPPNPVPEAWGGGAGTAEGAGTCMKSTGEAVVEGGLRD